MRLRSRRVLPLLSPGGATPLRRAAREASEAMMEVFRDWIADDALSDPLRAAIVELRSSVRLAVALLDEPDPDLALVERGRTLALEGALRLNAALASAYQDRWAPARTVLVACHAVARLIELLHATPPPPIPRWN